jgi:prophage regulatory protein
MQKILRIAAVSKQTGLSRRTIYNEIKAGRFPRPVQMTARCVGWTDVEIDAYVEERVRARDEANGRGA